MTSIEKLQDLVKRDVPFIVDYSSRKDGAVMCCLKNPEAEYENVFSTCATLEYALNELYEAAQEWFPEKFLPPSDNEKG